MKDLGKVIIVAVMNLVPSVIIPFILSHYKWISESESILLGVLIAILLTCGQVLFVANKLNEQERREDSLWIAQNIIDMKLSNIRESYRKILRSRRGDAPLLLRFFEDRITELELASYEAAERGVLHVDRRHVLSIDVLLENFTGAAEDIFRPVHFFRDNDFFFSWSKQYFYRVHQLVQAKKIRQVKRIMVYETANELNDPKSIMLMKFHALNDGYSYKYMKMSDFQSLMRDYRLENTADFGIYGDKCVYRARINMLDNIVGDWLGDPNVIAAYTQFFEACWASPTAHTLKTISKNDKLTIDDLFDEELVHEP